MTPAQVFRKRAFLNTPIQALTSALRRCSITLFNNNNRSITGSRGCWTVGAATYVKVTGCWKDSKVPAPRDRERTQNHRFGI